MRWMGTLCGAAMLFGAPALGQTGRVPTLPVSPLPGLAAPGLPEARPAAAQSPADAAAMPELRLSLSAVTIEGMTIYGDADFADMRAGLLAGTTDLAAIEAARRAVLDRYRDDGYALTAVTAVIEADRRLRLRVTEGRIAAVRLDGDIGPAGTQVLRFLNRLTEKPVIDAASLERALLLAGDVPGVTVRAVLRPSAEEPGALTLVAQVSRQAVAGQFSADNRAFASVGPEQGLAVLDLNSLSEFGEHTQLQLYRTLNGAQIFGNASLDGFIGADGLRIRLYGGVGQSQPTGTFRDLRYIGHTALFGTELSYPLIRSRRQTLNLVGASDVIEATVSEQGRVASVDSLRVLRTGADWVVADTWLGDAFGASNVLALRLSQGLPGLGATPKGSEQSARGGRQQPAFHKATLDVTRTQSLFAPWEGASLAVQGVLAGQFTNDVLPTAEKFLLGGGRLARGFYYGQVTGDRALAGGIELQLTTLFGTSLFGAPLEVSTQFYAFHDWAETWENLAGDNGRRLRSAGLGVRVIPAGSFEIDVEAVRRLTRFPTGGGAGVAPLPATAVYWRILARF